ncbi:hypothetical protein [Maribellus sp. YY47]|uniref:hypothetical protein n=1 Tax=Maribellus sp. YY47 TaxID=2929486 RepID=UPI0020009718|nr:hypothetical protein [Maribellus sp. YY47]MCK3684381.1 hypothetical protein [Maribellus sp. YY47]
MTLIINLVAPDHDELDYEKILTETYSKGKENDLFEYYLKEEWEKAGRQGISFDNFKDGCLEILEMWQDEIFQVAQQEKVFGDIVHIGFIVGEPGMEVSMNTISHVKDIIDRIVKEKEGGQAAPAKPTPAKWSGFHLLRPIFVDRFKEDHYNNLKQYFSPQEEFRKFVFGEPFRFHINFNGTQNQFACLFKKLKEDGDVHFPASNEKTAIYLYSAFVFKKKFGRSLVRYFTGKTPINPDDCIDSAI